MSAALLLTVKHAIADGHIWSEWRLTVIAATVRIALVDILDLSEVDVIVAHLLYHHATSHIILRAPFPFPVYTLPSPKLQATLK